MNGFSGRPSRACGILLLVGFIFVGSSRADDLLNPSVGALGRIEQRIIPGSELEVQPIRSDTRLVVRIVNAFPHGDAWRYDIEFYGLEPGQYDLRDYLRRLDGSGLDGVPPIEVEIGSVLPPGQIIPNRLAAPPAPRLGGYRWKLILAIGVWLGVFGWILFGFHQRRVADKVRTQPPSLADYLRPRLERAMRGELDSAGLAELERMLAVFWKRRLGIDATDPAEVLVAIKRDATAGPLLEELESWLHDPAARGRIELADLLKPYSELPLEGGQG